MFHGVRGAEDGLKGDVLKQMKHPKCLCQYISIIFRPLLQFRTENTARFGSSDSLDRLGKLIFTLCMFSI